MINQKLLTAALLGIGVFVSLEYTSIAQSTNPAVPPAPKPMVSPPETETTLSALDRQFIIDAAQGGMAEVTLGQMAVQKATNNAVKQYGQRMVQDHTKANQELMRLAAQKGVTPPKDVGPKYKAAMEQLSQLPTTSFDQAYINEAGINGHLESQAVFQRQTQLGKDPDLKAFAAKTLPTVEQHLQTARSMATNMTKENHNR